MYLHLASLFNKLHLVIRRLLCKTKYVSILHDARQKRMEAEKKKEETRKKQLEAAMEEAKRKEETRKKQLELAATEEAKRKEETRKKQLEAAMEEAKRKEEETKKRAEEEKRIAEQNFVLARPPTVATEKALLAPSSPKTPEATQGKQRTVTQLKAAYESDSVYENTHVRGRRPKVFVSGIQMTEHKDTFDGIYALTQKKITGIPNG